MKRAILASTLLLVCGALNTALAQAGRILQSLRSLDGNVSVTFSDRAGCYRAGWR
jgi:hypothetical protein